MLKNIEDFMGDERAAEPKTFYELVLQEYGYRKKLSPENLEARIEAHGTFPFYPATLKCFRCNGDVRTIGVRVESNDEYGNPTTKQFTAKEPVFCSTCQEMLDFQDQTCNACGRKDRFKGMHPMRKETTDVKGVRHTELVGWGYSWVCPHCQKPDEPKDLAIRKRVREIMEKIPPAYREFDPELAVDLEQVNRISGQYDYTEGSDKSKMHLGMLIFGKPNTGKTWAGFEVMKKHAEVGKHFQHYRCIDLQAKLHGDAEGREQTESDLKSAFGLMIDGFGEGVNGVAVLEAYRRIIASRVEWYRPIVLITDKTAQEFADIAKDRSMKDSWGRADNAVREIIALVSNPNKFVIYEMRDEQDRKTKKSRVREWANVRFNE